MNIEYIGGKDRTINYLDVGSRARIFVWYNPDEGQATLPFLTIDVYEYLESDGKAEEIQYKDYEITETDNRVKTMKFVTDKYFDQTEGEWRVLLLHPNHPPFYGFILKQDLDKSTQLYTYQCQDGSRAYQSKIRTITGTENTKYGMLKVLLSIAGSYDKHLALSGLRPVEAYYQKASGDIPAFNPLQTKIGKNALSYDSAIDVIRGLCLSDGALIDVYFDKFGVCQIEPIDRERWLTRGIVLTIPNTESQQFTIDKTNVLTGVRVKRDKMNDSGVYVASNIKLSYFFGFNNTILESLDTEGLPTVTTQSSENNNNANTNINTNTGATKDTITVNMMPSCGCHGKVAYKKYTKTYKNYCPMCKRTGTLTVNPKRVYEGEITCGNTGPACKTLGGASGRIKGCDADFCGYCGSEKNGTCRSKLTPADASTSSTTTNSISTSTTQNTQVDYNSQEYLAKEKDTAMDTMRDSLIGMFTFKIKIPINDPVFKELHTNSFLYTYFPKEWTLLNIEKWNPLFYDSQNTRSNLFMLNRYYIQGVKITDGVEGTWAELELNPFASSNSSYTAWMRKAEQAYVSATTSQNTNNNNTVVAGGTGTLVKSTNNSTLDNYIKQWIAGKSSTLEKAKAIHQGLMNYGVKYIKYYNFPKSGGKISKAFQQAHNGLNCGDTSVLTVGSMRAAGIDAYVGFRCDHAHFFTVMQIDGTKYYSDLTAASGAYSKRAWNTTWENNKCHSRYNISIS